VAVAERGAVRDTGGPPDPDGDFESLRALLIGPERRQLQALQDRFDDPVARGRDLARVLPQALRTRRNDRELTEALLPPVERAITASVRRNPVPLADALFPIMGPAIRRAVAASLASMMESINRTVEHSVSARALGWRWTAWRTGKPFAEIVLLNTLLYRVEQVFLIHRPTGLLLQHVGAGTQDPDLVSGMLTAIRDFVGDSFRVSGQDSLASLAVGELSVVIEQGPGAVLAAVVRGTPPPDFRLTLQRALEDVHLQLGEALERFEGDAAPFVEARPILEACMQSAYRELPRRRRVGLRLAAAALALGLVAVAVFYAVERSRWQRYLDLLSREPGIVVLEGHSGLVTHRVRGLRDALARDPSAMIGQAGLRADSVEARWDPYLALEPSFVLARARAGLNPPPGVVLSLEAGTLRAAGDTSPDWIDQTRRIVPLLAGVTRFDAGPAIADSVRASAARLRAVHLLFAQGAAQPAGDGMAAVDVWRAELRRLDALARLAGERVAIQAVGHSDDLGAGDANLILSQARAAHALALLGATAFEHLDVTTAGVGSREPLIVGERDIDRQQNRRVDLRVIGGPGIPDESGT
jgi:OOP family OmpA-OmpF porin